MTSLTSSSFSSPDLTHTFLLLSYPHSHLPPPPHLTSLTSSFFSSPDLTHFLLSYLHSHLPPPLLPSHLPPPPPPHSTSLTLSSSSSPTFTHIFFLLPLLPSHLSPPPLLLFSGTHSFCYQLYGIPAFHPSPSLSPCCVRLVFVRRCNSIYCEWTDGTRILS
ncbi:hypothetical protein Pcinc_038460 [Petrolisthes cinctipes]|uniref:Uncharacterized protein n=1 Tax=Petrolisthes cinctipes TaxID=88211 RepID=A0AAE1EKD8_PETCI|nr:hypothetical protein Pcinc_038460 [Petrolisthes cinctipes]